MRYGACVQLLGFMLVTSTMLCGQSTDVQTVRKYKLFDLGTLGGNFSGFYEADSTGDDFTPRPLNAKGQLAGTSVYKNDTTAGSVLWTDGRLQLLPTLPQGNKYGGGSNANGISNTGLVVGASSYGLLDNAINQLYFHAVLWTNGAVQDLGDLGGHDSWANYVNDAGVVVGYAYNSVPDPYSFYGTQYHAFTSLNGTIRDLGTLGGTDSEAFAVNDRGDIIGNSLVNNTVIPPFNQPQEDAFLWSQGSMQDLGNLGGAFSTPTAVNSSAQVTVISYDSTNQIYKSYLWTNGTKTALNSIGGNYTEALTLNDFGYSTGAGSDFNDVNFLAGLWDPTGIQRVLGTVIGDSGSVAFGINNHFVIVGGSGAVSASAANYAHAFVWQKGNLFDLNTLIPAGSSLTLNVAYAINEAGEIAGMGTTSSGDMHAFLLTPEPGAIDEAFITAASAPAAPGSFIHLPGPGARLVPDRK